MEKQSISCLNINKIIVHPLGGYVGMQNSVRVVVPYHKPGHAILFYVKSDNPDVIRCFIRSHTKQMADNQICNPVTMVILAKRVHAHTSDVQRDWRIVPHETIDT